MAEHTTIKVTVTFPLAAAPFHGDFAATATVGEVRVAGMQSFGISEDAATKYYLSHDNERLDDGQVLETVAGHAEAMKFTLVKEIVQGGA